MFLFYMSEEIEGREISARFRQGQFYIPKFYREMFDIREGDYFILEVVKHSHAKIKYKPVQKSEPQKREDVNTPSNEGKENTPNPYVDYKKPFKLLGKEEETPWNDD